MIIFLYGDNDFGIRQHIHKLREQYSAKYTDALEEVLLDLAESQYGDLEQALLAQPMFFTHRLVVVSGLSSVTENTDRVMSLISGLPDSTVAVFDGRGLDKRLKLFKELVKIPGAKEYPALNSVQLARWAQRVAVRSGAELKSAEASYLVQRKGNDQTQLSHELEKVVAAGGIITRQRIDDLVVADSTETVFDLIAAISSHRPAEALAIYEELVTSGANDQQLIGTLMWQYRTIALVLVGASDQELAACGVKQFAAQKARTQSRGLSRQDVARAYEALLVADMAIKSGEKKQHQAMVDLVLSLA